MSDADPSPQQQAFAKRLQAARRVRGFSQTRMAELLGVSLPRYHAWETGHAAPNKFELYAGLRQQLHVTVDWLFFGDTSAILADQAQKLEAAVRAAA